MLNCRFESTESNYVNESTPTNQKDRGVNLIQAK